GAAGLGAAASLGPFAGLASGSAALGCARFEIGFRGRFFPAPGPRVVLLGAAAPLSRGCARATPTVPSATVPATSQAPAPSPRRCLDTSKPRASPSTLPGAAPG